ncbi:MAG TPA: prolipoprotein diacylglyceryl transferase [Anaerolineales bacterium]|nr:prolipoprotein diacylglyceryl transferase [Anaerolineales bacterium]HNN13903.1 prolipoprotein diacylglyceryl transferase [Anaerolineales bacterium]HNO30521.1 prolipoprotein diacylglyceryl transferase [Anaerolineales bacterium]
MEGIALGPLLLRWNGVFIALGVAAGTLLFAFEVRRRNEDPEIVYHLFMPMLGWGLIGARLWHIFTPPLSSVQLGLTAQYYLSHPLDMLSVWIGGLGLPGALLGGCLALLYMSSKYELPFWLLTDMAAPGIALAQAIGRLGNYFNQELYGLPTSLPWGIFIDPAHRLSGFEQADFYHPLFAYESVLSFLNLALLLWLARKKLDELRPGEIFLSFLLLYSFERFLLEFLRLDVALVNGMNANQAFFSLLFILAGGAFFMGRLRKPEL